MESTKRIVKRPGVQASLIAGGITFLATTAPLFFPKVRKGISHALPFIKNIIRRADDPTELKQATEAEAKDEMAEQFKDKLTESIQSKANDAAEKLKHVKDENAEKVHSNAEKVKEKVQDTLLQVQEKIASAKDSGQAFQEEVSKRTKTNTGIRGANQLKGVNNLKGAASIKSSAKIKGPRDIKHYGDLKQRRA